MPYRVQVPNAGIFEVFTKAMQYQIEVQQVQKITILRTMERTKTQHPSDLFIVTKSIINGASHSSSQLLPLPPLLPSLPSVFFHERLHRQPSRSRISARTTALASYNFWGQNRGRCALIIALDKLAQTFLKHASMCAFFLVCWSNIS